MKNVLVIIMVLVSISGYAQEKKLPPGVDSAFHAKYADTRIASWWVEEESYFLDFSLKGHSYIAAYDTKGNWIETAEIISEFEIPQAMRDFIKKKYPSAQMSYCELVEKAGVNKFFRANLLDKGYVLHVICCDKDGKNIVVQEPIT